MTRNHTRGILAVGIIVLFIGVGIHPAFAVDTRQSMVDKSNEEECWDCKEVDDRQLVVLEKQLNRLEVYSKLLFVLSKQYPEIKEDYEELSHLISTLNTLDLKEDICDALYLVYTVISNTINYYIEFANYFEYKNLKILLNITAVFFGLSIAFLYEIFDCV